MALTTVPASLSATALTLTTAAQPNITSVGTLTGLTVSGAATFSSTVDAVADVTVSNTSTNSAGVKFATASANRYIESTHDGIINIGTGGTLGGGTKYLTIDSGNVGIGTDSPGRLLEVKGTSNPAIRLNNNTDNADIGLASSAGALLTGASSGDLVIARNGSNGISMGTSGTTRLRVKSGGDVKIVSGLLGIGMDATQALDIDRTSGLSIRFYESGTFRAGLQVANSSGQMIATSADNDFAIRSQSNLLFASGGNTERMRIDSSGNVLVGTTNANPTSSSVNDAGVELSDTGGVRSTVASNPAATFNRKTDDGAITLFRKDGSTVGSIGSTSGVVSYIVLDPRSGAKGAGLLGSSIDANTGILQPVDKNAALADGAINLGTSSNRFKNLYLSGVAYASYIGSSGDTDTSIAFDTTNSIRFSTAGAEAMRIDSSGNVLVGKSNTTLSTAGVYIAPSGVIVATRDSAEVLALNLTNSHGNIASFYKDGSTVGSIGTGSASLGRLQIGTGDTNLFFQPDSDYIGASNGTGIRDAAIDLGHSAVRWKDLYLSGGVFLGGTGSANELDDYEEGNWSPVLAAHSGTSPTLSGTNSGSYTKVGRLVSVIVELNVTSISGVTSGYITCSLPITAATGAGYYAQGSQTNSSVSWARPENVGPTLYGANKFGFLSSNNAGGAWGWETFAAFTGNEVMRISFSYFAA